jgi:hypothetical protein
MVHSAKWQNAEAFGCVNNRRCHGTDCSVPASCHYYISITLGGLLGHGDYFSTSLGHRYSRLNAGGFEGIRQSLLNSFLVA